MLGNQRSSIGPHSRPVPAPFQYNLLCDIVVVHTLPRPHGIPHLSWSPGLRAMGTGASLEKEPVPGENLSLRCLQYLVCDE